MISRCPTAAWPGAATRAARARRLLQSRESLHRLQKPPRFSALDFPQLARGDLGRGGLLSDARRGAQAFRAVIAAMRTRMPSTALTRTPRKSAAPITASAPSSGKSGTRATSACIWVAHGCEHILDEDDPHLELREFFPCPKPAYGTVQRGSLVPVPDVLQYRDQLEELNLLTGRIHALSDALEVKGFYPAGGGEIADAIADRDQRSRRRAACWCRSRTGPRSAAAKR